MTKIIQTYWTKPIMTDSSFIESRNSGGWLSFRYNCASWMYSCLRLRQFYNDVELYTDRKGYELLIEKLHLPYTKVHVCLNELLQDIPVQMWALSKLYTYNLQTEPFLHVDGDVYIWRHFPKEIENAELAVQNIERVKHKYHYQDALRLIKDNRFQIPPSLSGLLEIANPITSINAGILGGHDVDFINYYSKEALQFFHNNKNLFSADYAGQLNVVVEQLFFYLLANNNKKNISALFDNISEDFVELMEFDAAPRADSTGYIHLVGFAKKDYLACNMLEKHLQYDFPNEYATLSRCFPEEIVSDKEEQWQSFMYSMQIIETFVQKDGSLLSIVKSIASCTKNISEELYNLVASICRFEHQQHKLWHNNKQNDFDTSAFIRFTQARDFLNDITSEKLLQTKYRIADCVDIFAADFDILNITTEKAWTDKITSPEYLQSHSGTVVYLLKKYRNTITTIALEKLDIFLYYFSGEAISGEELVTLLCEELSFNINDDEGRKIAESFLKKHLLYTGYIVIVTS